MTMGWCLRTHAHTYFAFLVSEEVVAVILGSLSCGKFSYSQFLASRICYFQDFLEAAEEFIAVKFIAPQREGTVWDMNRPLPGPFRRIVRVP